MALFKEIVTSIRNLRQTFGIPHKKEVEIVINCEPGRSIPDRLRPFSSQIGSLAGVSSLQIADGAVKPKGSAVAGHASIEIYLPLEGVIDVEAEKKKLEKELGKLSDECEKTEKRLSDKKFTEKAPPEVIDREKAKYAEISEKRDRLQRILEDLR